MSSTNSPILTVDDLTVAYGQNGHWQNAVRRVSFELGPGQTLGLVGESGSGKSTLALSIMRYLPEGGMVRHGSVHFDGLDLLAQSRSRMERLWGARLALVPQDPISAVNPTIHLGDQMNEMLIRHRGISQREARDHTLRQLEAVQLADPQRVVDSYPHQLSGGMLQRVLIAMAMSLEPLLLVMDEPTSSLDVTTQAAILDLLRELTRGRQTAVLYITHDLGVVARVADDIAVMYAGEFMERAPTAEMFRHPLNPYTQGLLDSVPRLGQRKAQAPLRAIPGSIPSLSDLPEGCIFRPRCPLAIDVCMTDVPFYRADESRRSRCHRWDELAAGEVSARQPEPDIASLISPVREEGEPVLRVQDVSVRYERQRRFGGMLRKSQEGVLALDGVSLTISRGRTLGLVGESGSGKTTLARVIVGLTERDSGTIRLLDSDLSPGLRGRNPAVQRMIQIVFQDPEEALNPYHSVGETLRRPMTRLLKMTRSNAVRHVSDLLGAVRLSTDYAARLPGQLSGGEKQRVAIARAFAPQPGLLIADEPVSALDVSVQALVLNLLNELQAETDSSILFISHDLAVVAYVADDIAVIYKGHLVEMGTTDEILTPPHHPYTEELLASVPALDLNAAAAPPRPADDPIVDIAGPPGCRYRVRCPRFIDGVCSDGPPPWQMHEETGRHIYCHIPPDELDGMQRGLATDGAPGQREDMP
jgi:peptide/nickel transport system ATP-binding protein